MLRLAQSIFWFVIRWLLNRRYRVRVEGGEQLRDLHGPVLVMPNHPGYIDPPLVLSHIRLAQPLRPIVKEAEYRRPFLYPMMRLVEAFEMPEVGEHSRNAREQTLALIDAVAAGLKRGECFLLYPSGRIQRGGRERIGSNRAAADILQRCPETKVVLVRTRGIWGSVFTVAHNGQWPDLARFFPRGVAWMAANLVFFAPKRTVTMTVEVMEARDLPGLTRDVLNPFLEDWYSQGETEAPTFVPFHSILGPQEHEFPSLETEAEVDLAHIRPATVRAVNEMVEEQLARPLDDEERQPQTSLDELGLDSLQRMDLALAIEDRFGFRSDRVADTLGELWALADGQASQGSESAQPAPKSWFRAAADSGPPEVLAETIGEAFVRRALASLDDVAAADRLSGVLTYRRLLVGARLLSKRFRELPGDAVGVLLPASVAADLVYFALHLAGKLPVMLNWTTGPAGMGHGVEKTRLRRVVTSRRFVDRLGIEVPGAEFALLEDIRASIGKLEALAALAASYVMPRSFLRDLPQPDVGAPAVVLFTSGSESAPKAVPLSHRNLIADSRASIKRLEATRTDAILGFLPPFHSFGLTANILAPLLAGVRVVHYPDPTNAAGLVQTTAAYRPTITITTPTFLGYQFSVARPEDLESLRVIITGAEKCPETIFERARDLTPGAEIIEGYGITECSPVVAGNIRGRTKPGTVGPPVDGVEIRLVDPETRQPLPMPDTGMLLVHGPTVFSGYMDYEGADPFMELDGKRWYVTGDLVEVDEDRYIHFRGRLKRFIKAGGEMISLPALEEPLAARYPATDAGPQVAVEGIETPEGRSIVLFTTQDIALREANAILSEAGFRGVMRLDEVVRLDAIPVLGTGKTDYKVLRRMIVERTGAH